MALINCPECGKQISDKAKMCIGCGYPIEEMIPKISTTIINGVEVDIKALMEKYSSKVSAIKELKEMTGASLEEIKKVVEEVYPKKGEDEKQAIPSSPYTICPKCGYYNPTGTFTCRKCRHKYTANEYVVIDPLENKKQPRQEFNGVYRYTMFGGNQEVYCPRCGSSACSHYQEQKVIPGKTKTRYTVNLNPLKPFTLVNKKEKVVRKEQTYTESKFICNKCGKIFN